jgi:amino acid efflux transporter
MPDGGSVGPTEAAAPALRRRLGTADLATHYVASVLGAGVLILPGLAMETAGPAAVLAWVALVGFSYLFAWVLARLSAERPDCRGLPLFVRCAFRPGWERGVAMLLAAAMVGIIPVYGLAAAQALVNLGAVPAEWPPALPALAVVGIAVGLNLTGLRVGVRVQMATLALVVVALVAAVMLVLPEADPAHLAPFAPNGWMAVGTAAALCFFAVIGWENAAPLAEEVRDPARALPCAVALAVTLVGALYLAVAVGLALTTPPGAGGRASPVAAMLGASLGVGGDCAGNLMALVLLVVAANAWVLSTSRMVYGLARQRILPSWLDHLRPGDGIPARACLLVGAANATVLLATLAFGLGEAEIVSAVCAGTQAGRHDAGSDPCDGGVPRGRDRARRPRARGGDRRPGPRAFGPPGRCRDHAPPLRSGTGPAGGRHSGCICHPAPVGIAAGPRPSVMRRGWGHRRIRG